MRASTAVSLLLVSSMSIFGINSLRSSAAATVEPVYVNGVMGVYNPDTHVFVPSTSPLFDQTCELIARRRAAASGGSYYGGYHHWYYSPSSSFFTYHTSSGFMGMHSSSFSSSSSHIGSIRGGFGSTGHSHGASSS